MSSKSISIAQDMENGRETVQSGDPYAFDITAAHLMSDTQPAAGQYTCRSNSDIFKIKFIYLIVV